MSKYKINQEFMVIPKIPILRSLVYLRLLSSLVSLTRLFHKWGADVKIHRHTVASSDGRLLKLLEVKPVGAAASRPGLMYYHGGGFFLSYGRGHLEQIKRYALSANCSVFLVEYRLSTDQPFPASFDDCFAALQWVNDNATNLGIDINRLAVAGDSAGGCLAAAVAQKVTDIAELGQSDLKIAGQLLIYPVIDCETKTSSAERFVDTPVWNTGANKIMWNLYLTGKIRSIGASHNSLPPAYASPIHRQNFSRLPAAYIEAVEFDPLRDEAINYAKELKAAGVAVQLELVAGAVHGYDMVECELNEKYQSLRMDALKSFFTC